MRGLWVKENSVGNQVWVPGTNWETVKTEGCRWLSYVLSANKRCRLGWITELGYLLEAAVKENSRSLASLYHKRKGTSMNENSYYFLFTFLRMNVF